MAYLEVYLLGECKIFLNGQLINNSLTQKGEALLCYLLMNRKCSHSRDKLADLLWGQSKKDAARYNLRYTLWSLRRSLKATKSGEDFIMNLEKDACQFNDTADYWVDVFAFEKYASAIENFDLTEEEVIKSLQKALELYKGDFLEGFYIKASSDFDDYVFYERERLQKVYFNTLSTLSKLYTVRNQFGKAIECLTRMLNINPLQEEVHRELMNLYYLAGDRISAIRQYQTCQKILRMELNVSPMRETKELYQTIASNLEDTGSKQLESKQLELNNLVGLDRENLETLLNSVLQAGTGVKSSMHLFLGSKEISEANAKIAKKVCSLPDKDFFIVKDNPNGVKGIRYEVASKILSSLLSKVDNADFAAIPPVVLAQLGYLIPDIQLLHLQYPVFQGSADLEKIRIFSAFEILLKTLSEQKPIFVFVCNMQFVDSVSLELISYLIRRGPKKNLLQVFTYDREMVGDELLQFLQSIAKVDNCLVKNI